MARMRNQNSDSLFGRFFFAALSIAIGIAVLGLSHDSAFAQSPGDSEIAAAKVSKATGTIDPSTLAPSTLTPTFSGTAAGTASVSISILDHGGVTSTFGPVNVKNGKWTIAVSPALKHYNSAYFVSLLDGKGTLITKSRFSVTITRPPRAASSFKDGLHFALAKGEAAMSADGSLYVAVTSVAAQSASLIFYENCDSACDSMLTTLAVGATTNFGGHSFTLVSAKNNASVTLFATETSVERELFGVWRILPEDYGTRVIDLPRAPTFTNLAINTAPDLQAGLAEARAKGMHVLLRIGNRGTHFSDFANSDGTFSLQKWEAIFDRVCPPDANGKEHCVDLSSYVNDGTIVALHLLETNGEPDDPTTGAPTLDDVRHMAAYAKTLWPYLPTAIDGSHACDIDNNYGVPNLDYEIINVYTGNSTPDNYAGREALVQKEVACARKEGLGYFILVNPLGYTQHDGFGKYSLPTFEHFMEYALRIPGSNGTFIWRNADTTTPTITQGKKVFVNFWNEKMNPGITAAMSRIYTCAISPTAAHCAAGAPAK